MVTEVWNEELEKYVYQPATDINRMTLSFVLEQLDSSGSQHKVVRHGCDILEIQIWYSYKEKGKRAAFS